MVIYGLLFFAEISYFFCENLVLFSRKLNTILIFKPTLPKKTGNYSKNNFVLCYDSNKNERILIYFFDVT